MNNKEVLIKLYNLYNINYMVIINFIIALLNVYFIQ